MNKSDSAAAATGQDQIQATGDETSDLEWRVVERGMLGWRSVERGRRQY